MNSAVHARGHLRPSRTGFTLIELLVVIAIIALLLSVLLPALAKARKAGQGAVCLANQHSLLMAVAAYANDAKDYFVPMQDYHSQVGTYTQIEGNWRVYLFPYVGGAAKVYDCPAERADVYADGLSQYDLAAMGTRVRPSDEFEKLFGYLHPYETYNASGIGASGVHWGAGREGRSPFGRPTESGYPEGLVKRSEVEFPSLMVLFGDGHGDSQRIWPEDRWWLFKTISPWRTIGFNRLLQRDPGAVRHNGKANYGYDDASVRSTDANDLRCDRDQCSWSVKLGAHSPSAPR